MAALTPPLLDTAFVYDYEDIKRMSVIWQQWLLDVDTKLDLTNGLLSFSGSNITSDSGDIGLVISSQLFLNNQLWAAPTITGQFLTANNGQLIWDTVEITETISSGIVREYIGDLPTGWIDCDDGTIGNANSGASNRANSDTEDLYTVLWNNCSDTACPVSGGRGASAAIDYAANKTLRLPLNRGRALKGAPTLTDVGLTNGAETVVMTETNNPPHEHIISNTYERDDDVINIGGTGIQAASPNDTAGNKSYTTNLAVLPATDVIGSGTAQNIIQPTIFYKRMIKL